MFLTANEMTLLRKVIVERGVCGDEALQGLHAAEPLHRPFSSAEG